MNGNHLRVAITASALTALASCVSTPPPPEYWSVGYTLITQQEGYVSAVGYFSPAQVADARWEFRRVRAAQGNMCRGYQQFILREVAWFETTPASQERCARVVYTVLCTPADQGPPAPDAATIAKFKTRRDALLNEPPRGPIEPGCGEKDRAKLPPPPPRVRPAPPPPIDQLH